MSISQPEVYKHSYSFADIVHFDIQASWWSGRTKSCR